MPGYLNKLKSSPRPRESLLPPLTAAASPSSATTLQGQNKAQTDGMERGRGRGRDATRRNEAHKAEAPRDARGRTRAQAAPARLEPSPPRNAAMDTHEVIPASQFDPSTRRSPSPPGLDLPIKSDWELREFSLGSFRPMSAKTKQALIAEAVRRNNENYYSTAAMPMALARKLMELEAKSDHKLRFADVRQKPPMNERELMEQYNGGTCFTLCADFINYVQKEFKLRSFALIAERSPQNMALWPSFTKPDGRVWVEDILQHVSYLGHIDLVIPYREGPIKKVLLLPTGQPKGAKIQDVSFEEKFGKKAVGRLLHNPNDVAFRALWGRIRLHIAHREEQTIFGIDFIEGVLFLNSTARKAVQRVRADRGSALYNASDLRCFQFSSLPPRDELPMTSEGNEAWAECISFLEQVGLVFDLPDRSLVDLIYLIDRRDSYMEDVVHPMARALRDSTPERLSTFNVAQEVRDALAQAGDSANDEVVAGIMATAGSFLTQARGAVIGCDGTEAKAKYRNALEEMQKAAALLHVSQLPGALK